MGLAAPAGAQIVEGVGVRALGMGGAFVAVANDSSATWWNPAGLAAGPFLDLAIARTVTEQSGVLPAARDRIWSFSAGTPPFGLSYYRLRITDIRLSDPTEQERADREDRRAGVHVRSLSASQFGATIIQTLVTGVHVGTTLKYVRGTARTADIAGADAVALQLSELLDRGDDLGGGEGLGPDSSARGSAFDLDVGLLAVRGPIRLGGLVRNVREPEIGGVRLPRQIRIGAAYDGDAIGALPLTIALDADVRTYRTGAGDRRVVAVGAEQWLAERRLGVRAGARFNTAGAEDRAVTAGASVAVQPGRYVDGHVVYGGSGEHGWGLAARISF